MNPTRGLAQSVPNFAGFALQQVHLARAFLNHSLLKTTTAAVLGVHAPFGKELGLVQASAGAGMQQVLGRVKANAAGAYQGHGFSDSAFVTQHVQVAHDLGVVDALDVRHPRRHAGGQHHLLETGSCQILRADAGVQSQRHAVQLDLSTVITQGLIKLFLARHLFGHVELAADFASSIKQSDIKSAAGGSGGKGQTGRPGAHHGNALFGWRRGFDHQRLVAGARIDQAGGDLAAEGVVQAGLVAADAGVDIVGLALGGLAHKFCIRQERAGHGDHVGHAVGQNLLGHFRRVDAVGGHQGNAHLALELLRDPGKSGARHLGGDGRNARLVPANAGVQNADARCFQRLGQLHHFFLGGAAFDQVQHGEAKDDDEILSHLGAGASHDFQGESNAVFIAAAPGVVAVVGLRRDKFIDQVALRAHDFHAVVAGALGQSGGIDIVVYGLLDFFCAQRVRAEHVDGRLERTGRHQLGVVGIAAEMQDLHGDLAAGFMHGLGHHLVFVSFGLGRHACAAGHGAGAVIRGNATGHDQAHAPLGPLGIKSGHALKSVLGFFQTDVHGAHDHAVFQIGKAQVQGGEHVGVGGHLGGPMGNQTLVTQFTQELSELQLT